MNTKEHARGTITCPVGWFCKNPNAAKQIGWFGILAFHTYKWSLRWGLSYLFDQLVASKKQRGISFQVNFAVPTPPSETARKSCQQRMPMTGSLEHNVNLWWQYAAPRHPRPVALQSISRAPNPSRQRCFWKCLYTIVANMLFIWDQLKK